MVPDVRPILLHKGWLRAPPVNVCVVLKELHGSPGLDHENEGGFHP